MIDRRLRLRHCLPMICLFAWSSVTSGRSEPSAPPFDGSDLRAVNLSTPIDADTASPPLTITRIGVLERSLGTAVVIDVMTLAGLAIAAKLLVSQVSSPDYGARIDAVKRGMSHHLILGVTVVLNAINSIERNDPSKVAAAEQVKTDLGLKRTTTTNACPEPPPPGTACYRLDTIGTPHYCVDTGTRCIPHYNLCKRNQNPQTGECFWNKVGEAYSDGAIMMSRYPNIQPCTAYPNAAMFGC